MNIAHWFMVTTPTPDAGFDPNTVTPGWVGFVAVFFIAIATILLILDMTRRVRRVRYRAEVGEKLAAERASGAAEPTAADGTTSGATSSKSAQEPDA
ncbi:MAG: hypothetical protein ABI400_05755 [Lacisediminihabitans sp.]